MTSIVRHQLLEPLTLFEQLGEPIISTKHHNLPPNGRLGWSMISRILLSSDSTPCLFIIVTSSQIIRDVVQSSLAVPIYFVKLQKAPSSRVRGILKREWAVLPPSIIEAATPDVVVAMAIFF